VVYFVVLSAGISVLAVIHGRRHPRPWQAARRVLEQPWEEAYVYFKHDEGIGSGPPAVSTFVEAMTQIKA
jgi:hypothetical protein